MVDGLSFYLKYFIFSIRCTNFAKQAEWTEPSVLLDSFQNQLQTPIIIVVHFMAEHYNTHCVRNLKRIKW